MNEGWRGDLAPLMRRISQVATGSGSLFVFAASSRLALALPKDRRAARIVTDLYQPQRWKGRLFHGIARWMVAFGVPKFRSTHMGTNVPMPAVDWLKAASVQGRVGFLGCNPNHGPRCVLAGIDPINGEKFIAKLGLDESAPSIRREAEVLDRLRGRFPGVILPVYLQTADSLQSLFDSKTDFDWALLRLPHLGTASPKSMKDANVAELLENWLGKENKPLGGIPWAEKLLARVPETMTPTNWHGRMISREIRTALLHGDFAIWNLRSTPKGLVAIDWEWGVEDAVAGIDLAHGLRQECYMVRCMKPEDAVAWMLEQANTARWRDYLDTCGWSGAHEDWLRLGLLHSHFNALNPSADLLDVLGIHLRS